MCSVMTSFKKVRKYRELTVVSNMDHYFLTHWSEVDVFTISWVSSSVMSGKRTNLES